MEQATDLIEFIGRTGGATHLKVSNSIAYSVLRMKYSILLSQVQSGHLNLVQYYSVDCLLFLVLISASVLWLSYVCTTACIRWGAGGTRGDKKKMQ